MLVEERAVEALDEAVGLGPPGFVVRRSGAMVIAVVRGDHPESNPDAEFRIEAGDHLVLVGSHAEVEAAFEILNPQHVSVRG